MEKRINIFICHTPFQIYVARQICTTQFAGTNFENLIITTVKPQQKISEADYLWIPTKMPERLTRMLKAKRTIRFYSRKFRERAEFFLPHIDGVLSNYVFNSKTLSKNDSKINLYYEGALMVDPKRKERNSTQHTFEKKVLSAILLHRFTKPSDLLPLRSPRINKVYTPYPERTPADEERKVLISFPRKRIQNKKGGILIIGVDVGEYLEESVRHLIEFIRNDKSYGSVFFKPHYADRKKIFQSLAKESGFQYTLVQDSRCIEEVIGELEVDTVIGMLFSSALLNLKSIYKNELNVLFLAHPKMLTLLGEEYVDMISSMGIKIIPSYS